MVKENCMKKITILSINTFTFFLLLFNSQVCALDVTDKLTISGFIKNETAVRLEEWDKFMKIENMAQLEVEYRLTPHISVFGILREWYDSAFDAEEDWEHNRNILARTKGTDWLREAYLDYYSNKLDLRIGKQQVVWGTADGVKILDIVCPMDMREFVLDEFAESRIPLWMFKAEYSPKIDGTLQVLFVPDFEPNFISPANSPFTFWNQQKGSEGIQGLRSLSHAIPAWGTVTKVHHDPGQSFKNSKVGVRWLDIYKGFEYSINYLHGWDLSAATKVKIKNIRPIFLLLGLPPGGDWIFERAYGQTETFGGSFSKALTSGPLRGLTIRGELAYIHNHMNNYGTSGKVTKMDQVNYVIGLDKYIWTNWFFSFQFIQFYSSIDSKHGEDLIFGPTGATLDKFENSMSLKISTDFFHERLKAEVLTMYGDDNDWRTSPRFEFELTDQIILATGLNVFWGKRSGLNGEFRENDEAYFEFKYGF
jgi:hypothetical protein